MSRMYSASIDAEIPGECLSEVVVHKRIQQLVAALPVVPGHLAGWVEHSRKGPVMVADEERFLEVISLKAKRNLDKYPGLPNAGSAEAKITTATTQREWDRPGRASVDYMPWAGRLTLTVNDPIEAFGVLEAPRIIRQCLAAIATTFEAHFIGTDVVCPLPGGNGYDTYAGAHQLFPHRRWLGWMGFVPELVPRKFIPEAAAMEVVKGRGTIIVSVDEPFDLRNPDHLKRAHHVELRMANAGLLDITDPSLL